jgi:hypothetical protein
VFSIANVSVELGLGLQVVPAHRFRSVCIHRGLERQPQERRLSQREICNSNLRGWMSQYVDTIPRSRRMLLDAWFEAEVEINPLFLPSRGRASNAKSINDYWI